MRVVNFSSRSGLLAGAVVLTGLVVGVAVGQTHSKKKSTVASHALSGKSRASAKTSSKTAGKSASSRVVSGKKRVNSSKSGKAAPFHQGYTPVPQARTVVVPQVVTRTVVVAPSYAQQEVAKPLAEGVEIQQPSGVVPEGPAPLADASVAGQMVQSASALRYPGALRKWFDALRVQGGPDGTTTVRALQFGDSHTAADMMSGEMRSQIQARFGNGGVGFTFAGHPFAGYRILGSGRGQSGGWQTLGTHFTQLGDGLLGMGGVAIETARGGESVQLDVSCRTMQVDYLQRGGGGSFHVKDDGLEQMQVFTDTLQTPAPTAAVSAAAPAVSVPVGAAPMSTFAGMQTVACTSGINNFQIVTDGDGPVRLLGTTALQPGATWEAIGINGAEAPLILRWNSGLFDSYLQRAAPQLITLVYGTNEAAGRWTGEEYAATFARLVDHLHTLAPGASILVVGPGDRAIASSHVTVTGTGRHARKHVSRSYVPYVGTERILNAQREVCRTHDCAFWDWQAKQGGFGAVMKWAAAGYAQPDHTHLTGTGYRALADGLFADLMAAYDAAAVQ